MFCVHAHVGVTFSGISFLIMLTFCGCVKILVCFMWIIVITWCVLLVICRYSVFALYSLRVISHTHLDVTEQSVILRASIS
jgi:hypothetical protein